MSTATFRRLLPAISACALSLLACGCRSTSRTVDAAARPRAPIEAVARPEVTASRVGGALELDRMLADRPRLREALADRASIREWLVARFAGHGQPFAVYWDPTEPQSGQPAEHVEPEVPGGRALLRVRHEYSGTDQLAGAVYELINLEDAPAMMDAWSDARSRRVSRAAFAERMTRLEYDGLLKFQRFAREHGLAAGADDVLLSRLLDAPQDYAAFTAWTARLREEGGGHSAEAYWGRAHDTAETGRSSD